MSAYTDLQAFIIKYVGNYPVEAFHDLRMQGILLRLLDVANGGSSPSNSLFNNIIPVTSANFSTATDCPIVSMDGRQFELSWSEGGRFLEQDAGEWSYLAGGGFSILIPGFDSTAANYHLKVYPR